MFEKAEDEKYEMVVSDRWKTKVSTLQHSTDYRLRAIDLMEAMLLVICMSHIPRNLRYGGMSVGEMM